MQRADWQRKEALAFSGAALLVFAYVLLRAVLVPWVNDEAFSLGAYVESRDFLPFRALMDANNHPLNSAIGCLMHELFGLSRLGSRIGSVLAFVLFAWAAYQLGLRAQDAVARWCLWLALLGCPFLLDFFSLFRGYGIAFACWLAATEMLMRLVERWSTRRLAAVLILLIVGHAAVLVTVPLWLAVQVVLAALLFRSRAVLAARERARDITLLVLLGVLPWAGAMAYSWALKEHGALYWGSLDGFMNVVMRMLLLYVIGDGSPKAQWGVLLAVVLASGVLLLPPGRRAALLVPVGLLWTDALSRVAMAHLLGINYPMDRAAAHLVPWALLVIAYAADRLALRSRWLALLALPLLWLPARTVMQANLRETMLWTFQSPPDDLVRRIGAIQAAGPRLLSGPEHMRWPLALEARRQGVVPTRVDVDAPDARWMELRIVVGRDAARSAQGFHVLDSFPATGHYLLERDAPLRIKEELAWQSAAWDGAPEYLNLLDSDTLLDGHDRILEVSGPIDSGGAPLPFQLVVATVGGEGTPQYYEGYPLEQLRPCWTGEALRVRLLVPAHPGASGRSIYFWNVRQRSLRAGPFRLRLLKPST